MRGRILGTGLLVIGVLLTTLTPAAATGETPDGAAELIREAAPDQGSVLAGHVLVDEIRARVGRVHVAVPLNSDRAVTLDAVGLDAAAPLEVRLPAEINVSHGRTARDGTVVYPPTDAGETIAAVQILDDGGVRLQTVTPDASWVLGMGSCLKFVYYGHVANVWQPYDGSEAGRYCR